MTIFLRQRNSFYSSWSRVNHLKFGHGVILSYTGKKDDLKVQVDFEKYGKWLVLSYTQLEFIN